MRHAAMAWGRDAVDARDLCKTNYKYMLDSVCALRRAVGGDVACWRMDRP